MIRVTFDLLPGGDASRARTMGIMEIANVETRLDGTMRGDRRPPDDPGAAVYFTLKARRLVLACDKWDRVADNLAAIAAHIDALRAQERYGVGTVEQAFSGYAKLPAPDDITWRTVLGLGPLADLQMTEDAFRRLSMQHHPDRGGSHERMAALNAAIAEARKYFGGKK